MNNDGWNTTGVGASDMRVASEDLQHARQKRTADEVHVPVRIVRQQANGGGPMKEKMDQQYRGLHHELAAEKERHKQSQSHAAQHIDDHAKRPHDSQYGHDKYKYPAM